MYVVTKQTAVWVDDPADVAPRRAPRPKRIQRWATRPLRTPEGMLRALRIEGDDKRVLVCNLARRRWVPSGRVLSDEELEGWMRTGFRCGG